MRPLRKLRLLRAWNPRALILSSGAPSAANGSEADAAAGVADAPRGSDELQVRAFEASARQTPGRLAGWRFDRDEANRRA